MISKAAGASASEASSQLCGRSPKSIDQHLQLFFTTGRIGGNVTVNGTISSGNSIGTFKFAAPYADFGTMKINNAALYMSARPGSAGGGQILQGLLGRKGLHRERGATGRALTRVLRAGACAWGTPRLRYGNARCSEKLPRRHVHIARQTEPAFGVGAFQRR